MADFSNLIDATRAVVDPSTLVQDLASIAQLHPSLLPQIAEHPNGRAALQQWLGASDSAQIDGPMANAAVASHHARKRSWVKIVVIAITVVLVISATTGVLVARYGKPGGMLNQWQFNILAQKTWPTVSGMPVVKPDKPGIDQRIGECPQAFSQYKTHWVDYASNDTATSSTKLYLFDSVYAARDFTNNNSVCAAENGFLVPIGSSASYVQYDSDAIALSYGTGKVVIWMVAYRNVVLSTPASAWNIDLESVGPIFMKAVDQV